METFLCFKHNAFPVLKAYFDEYSDKCVSFKNNFILLNRIPVLEAPFEE